MLPVYVLLLWKLVRNSGMSANPLAQLSHLSGILLDDLFLFHQLGCIFIQFKAVILQLVISHYQIRGIQAQTDDLVNAAAVTAANDPCANK